MHLLVLSVSLMDGLILLSFVSDGLMAKLAFLHCSCTVKFYHGMSCSSSLFLGNVIQWLFGHFDCRETMLFTISKN